MSQIQSAINMLKDQLSTLGDERAKLARVVSEARAALDRAAADEAALARLITNVNNTIKTLEGMKPPSEPQAPAAADPLKQYETPGMILGLDGFTKGTVVRIPADALKWGKYPAPAQGVTGVVYWSDTNLISTYDRVWDLAKPTEADLMLFHDVAKEINRRHVLRGEPARVAEKHTSEVTHG